MINSHGQVMSICYESREYLLGISHQCFDSNVVKVYIFKIYNSLPLLGKEASYIWHLY